MDHLTDHTLKRLALLFNELELPDWRDEVINVLRGRRTMWLTFEADLLNADIETGALVEEGSDPVADALAQLRGERP